MIEPWEFPRGMSEEFQGIGELDPSANFESRLFDEGEVVPTKGVN